MTGVPCILAFSPGCCCYTPITKPELFIVSVSLLSYLKGTYDKKRVFPEKPYEDKRKAKVYGDRAKFAITSLPNPLEFFGYVRALLLRVLFLPLSCSIFGIIYFEIPSNVLCRLPVCLLSSASDDLIHPLFHIFIVITYCSYIYCFTCLLAGPAFEYTDYVHSIDGSVFENKNAKDKDSKDKKKVPSSFLPAMERLAVGVACLVGHLVIGGKAPLSQVKYAVVEKLLTIML
jgi:hypothetical protein